MAQSTIALKFKASTFSYHARPLCVWKFNSRKEIIRIEHILASAAAPTLFPAVQVDDDALWDGLFSDNSPLDDPVRKASVGEGNVPHEIWIIKINPTTRATAPWTRSAGGRRRGHPISRELPIFG